MRAVADRYGVGYNRVRDILVSRGVHLRDQYERANTHEPTPEEIEERAEEIRKGWDKMTRERRRVTRVPTFLTVPVVHVPPHVGKQLRVI